MKIVKCIITIIFLGSTNVLLGQIEEIYQYKVPMKWYKKYDEISAHNGKCISVKKNNLWGIIDSNEKIIIPITYKNRIFSINDTLFIISSDNKRGIINKKREIFLPFEYENIWPVLESDSPLNTKYLNLVKQYGKSGIIDLNKNVLIPLEYNKVDNRIYGHWCEKDSTIDIYNGLFKKTFSSDYIWVNSMGRIGKINFVQLGRGNYSKLLSVDDGKLLIDSMDNTNLRDYCENSFFKFQKNEKFGLINKEGKVCVQPIYSSLDFCSNNPITKREDSNYICAF